MCGSAGEKQARDERESNALVARAGDCWPFIPLILKGSQMVLINEGEKGNKSALKVDNVFVILNFPHRANFNSDEEGGEREGEKKGERRNCGKNCSEKI